MNKIITAGCVAVAAFTAVAMPSKEELAKAQRLVKNATKSELSAFKARKKTEKDVADAHVSLARRAESEAEKYLLYQGAFKLYVRCKEYDLAADVIEDMKRDIKDIPREVIVEIVSREIRYVAKGKAPRLAAMITTANDNTDSGQKLPSKSMPKNGLMAAFDYSGDVAENSGYGTALVHRDDVTYKDGVAVFDGKYKFRAGEDVIIPDFNYDHFAVAFSFKPDNGAEMFRIGEDSHAMLEINMGTWNGEHVTISGAGSPITSPADIGRWNWVVVSVDVRKRLIIASVNGKGPVERMLPDDFHWQIPSRAIDGDAFRRIHFGNANRGIRYSGAIDDLMVYDRALTKAEIADIAKGRPAKGGKSVVATAQPAKAKKAKLVPGKWVFSRRREVSMYWNGTLETKGITLDVHESSDGLVVQPIGQLRYETIDLSMPIVTEGKDDAVSIFAIGSQRSGVYCASGSGVKSVLLPSTLRELQHRAFSGALQLETIELPKTLEKIADNAFYSCAKLESIVIPENVEEIGSRAFADCGCLSKVEVRAKSVEIAKDAFSGNTPVGVDMPKEKWTTGPMKKEIKGDPKYEYAKEGRMKEALFQFGYGDIRLGDKHGDIGGWGSTILRGRKDLGQFDLSFIKVGPGMLAGIIIKWRKKFAKADNAVTAQQIAECLVQMLEDKLNGKIARPKYLPESEWPEYGDKGKYYADYGKLTPIGSAQSDLDGYKVVMKVYGGTKEENFSVQLTIIDTFMFKAWGLPFSDYMK